MLLTKDTNRPEKLALPAISAQEIVHSDPDATKSVLMAWALYAGIYMPAPDYLPRVPLQDTGDWQKVVDNPNQAAFHAHKEGDEVPVGIARSYRDGDAVWTDIYTANRIQDKGEKTEIIGALAEAVKARHSGMPLETVVPKREGQWDADAYLGAGFRPVHIPAVYMQAGELTVPHIVMRYEG